jgi:class 3 adenylate cyclase/tetratricopeptide (TPR) repeat protein
MPFRRHIPDLAIDWAMRHPEHRWRTLPGTLVFADISGFTALAERLAQRGRSGGEELVETLSRVFAAMIDIAHGHGGMLLKFGGDALLLFFDGAEHTRRAAGAAIEMRRALREAAKIPTSVGPLKLSMSVGLHSGDITFFLVGSTHRELVLLGEPATTVIETESAAASGEILLSPAAARELPAAAVEVRPDGRFRLRGQRSPFRAPLPRPVFPADPATVASLFPHTLGQYLATRPEPEHRVACIAFMRFSGTDAYLRDRGPAALAQALDDTVSVVQQALVREGATLLALDIDKDGGKFFVGAGVPYAHEDDEGVMLRATRQIISTPLPLPLQIGVNRGHVFAAEVGARDRAAYSAMGDTTNVAARIASKVPPGSIYVHPSVLDQSLMLFEVQPAGPFQFKGKKLPMLVYDVGREIGPRRREGLQVETFVGRPQELATLRAAVEAEAGTVVLVVGDAGLGKSRLVNAALSATSRPMVRMRAEPYGAGAPFRLVRDALRDLLGIRGAGPAELAAALTDLLSRRAPQQLPWLSLIGDALDIAIEPSDEAAALQMNFRSERRATALLELIATTCPERLVWFIDDAQWADEASVELLTHVARAARSRGWMVCIARRDGSSGFRPAADVELTLAPMMHGDLQRLVELATEAAPLRAHDVEEVVRRAGGNPLFAMEILRASREAGSIDAVPQSLEATLAAQIDELDASARRLLRFASVLGNAFPLELLRQVVEGHGDPFDAHTLRRLDDFLESTTEPIRFRNGLMRDATYASVAFRLRARLHGLAGQALERAQSEDVDALALHFSRAGDAERTWRYATNAAQRARKSYANAAAARYYEMALTAARRLPVLGRAEHVRAWTELGDARELAGHFADSLSAYGHALRVAGDDASIHADLMFGRARAKERAGAFSSALRDITLGLKRLDASDDPAAAAARARLRSFQAMVLFAQDRAKRALVAARAAVAEARAAGEQASLGRALIVTELARLVLQGPGDGTHLKEALAIYEALGDVRQQAGVRNNLGALCTLASRWDEAIEWQNSSRELYVRTGDLVGSAFCALNTAEILINQRRCHAAEPLVTDALRIVKAAEFAEGVASVELQLARIFIERGDYAQAESILKHSVDEFARLGKSFYLLDATTLRADARLRAGDPAMALEWVQEAQRVSGEQPQLRPKTAWVLSRALGELERVEEAQTEIEAGLEAARAVGALYEEGLLLSVRADLFHDSTARRRSEEIFSRLGVVTTPSLLVA